MAEMSARMHGNARTSSVPGCAIVGLGVVGSAMMSAAPTSVGVDSSTDRVRTHAHRGRKASCDLTAIGDSQIIFLCLPTPPGPDARPDVTAVHDVVRRIERLPLRRDAVVVIRSTLFPDQVPRSSSLPIIVNPEFLREACAEEDFVEAPLVVIGAPPEHKRHVEVVARWYARWTRRPDLHTLSIESALLFKYACNWWRAMKVEFANLVGDLGADWGADARQVMELFVSDTRLNLSRAYLTPGSPFGGRCLPKDLLAGVAAMRGGTASRLLESVLAANVERGGPDPRPATVRGRA